MKTIEDYITDLDTVNAQIKPLEAKRTHYRNTIKKMRDNASKIFHTTLPEKVEDYTGDQICWLLYHWHDDTQSDYDKKNKIFHSYKLFASGINGGKALDDVRQYKFLATDNWFPHFLDFYKIVKTHIKDFPSSVEPSINIIELNTHTDVFGWDSGSGGICIEIDKENDKGRFIKKYGYSTSTSDWVSFEKIQELLVEYKTY